MIVSSTVVLQECLWNTTVHVGLVLSFHTKYGTCFSVGRHGILEQLYTTQSARFPLKSEILTCLPLLGKGFCLEGRVRCCSVMGGGARLAMD